MEFADPIKKRSRLRTGRTTGTPRSRSESPSDCQNIAQNMGQNQPPPDYAIRSFGNPQVLRLSPAEKTRPQFLRVRDQVIIREEDRVNGWTNYAVAPKLESDVPRPSVPPP